MDSNSPDNEEVQLRTVVKQLVGEVSRLYKIQGLNMNDEFIIEGLNKIEEESNGVSSSDVVHNDHTLEDIVEVLEDEMGHSVEMGVFQRRVMDVLDINNRDDVRFYKHGNSFDGRFYAIVDEEYLNPQSVHKTIKNVEESDILDVEVRMSGLKISMK